MGNINKGLTSLKDMASELGTDMLGPDCHPIKKVFKGQMIIALETGFSGEDFFFMLMCQDETNWNTLSFKQTKTQVVKVDTTTLQTETICALPGIFQQLAYDSSKNKLYVAHYDESNNKTKLFLVDC